MMLPSRVVGVLLVLVVVLLQVSIVQRIEVGDASPDLVVLVVVSLALLSNSVDGAATGFLAGLSLALFAALPLGPHALIATLVGYFAGRWGEALVTDEHPLPPLVVGVVATFAMQMGRPLLDFLVNPYASAAGGLWDDVAIVTLTNAVLAIPVYALVRRVMYGLGRSEQVAAGGEA
jgi:rod shape-determining protein MreD